MREIPLGHSHDFASYRRCPCVVVFHIIRVLYIQVKFLDLTLPQYWLPRYDWVLSTEVLEHIPAQYETVVLDNIDRAAGHGVVLSWAAPRQLGFYHVNNRPPAYVNQAMFDREFIMDQNASLVLRARATNPNLKNNVRVYIRLSELQNRTVHFDN